MTLSHKIPMKNLLLLTEHVANVDFGVKDIKKVLVDTKIQGNTLKTTEQLIEKVLMIVMCSG
ncbi:hypothetical protein THOM_2391 [Trachipleistophora hominis]|uniref:Uncharacterized protein n=1 Tax=Trachipleistophora hominis TaxID=72359 RepID=L7JT94_TRAHO|nr:hypothetical protein THOM_2391 [Trachipleistophora hominis]